jgi:predicted CopG family antitoxin
MVVKTVTLTKEAYDALAAMKNAGESFSEVVTRLTGSKVPLSAIAGAWAGAPQKKLEALDRFFRDSGRLSVSKLQKLSSVSTESG